MPETIPLNEQLFTACLKDDLKAIEDLIRQDALELADISDQTPLEYAHDNGNLEIMITLLKQTSEKRSSYHYEGKWLKRSSYHYEGKWLNSACKKGNLKIVKFLVQHGVLNNLVAFGVCILSSPLIVAYDNNHPEIIDYLIAQDSDKINAHLYSVCASGHFEIARQLIERGALEHTDYSGRTAFWFACDKGNIDVIKYLVERGVEIVPKKTSIWIETPLKAAFYKNHLEVLQFLVPQINESEKIKLFVSACFSFSHFSDGKIGHIDYIASQIADKNFLQHPNNYEALYSACEQACHYAHDIFRPSCPLKIFA